MSFTSASFLFLFLPVVVGGFFLISGRRAASLRQAWLVAMSVVFYGVSGTDNLAFLLGSMTGNFLIGRHLSAPAARWRRAGLWLGVVANVGMLAAFKGHALLAPMSGSAGFLDEAGILIPLALSFVTFQQIGFLVECWRGRIGQPTLHDYCLFVLFFPQLIMGPIVQYGQIAGQVAAGALARRSMENLAVGFSIFIFGLFKKAVVADSLAVPVADIFHLAAIGQPVTPPQAWAAAVGFQLQLFLDFSGYADMAIGLARIFGIALPINFDAPLKAVDRFDLWRRWHITFCEFMRTHVFTQLVRHLRLPVVAALALSGIISGLWHGLGFTFVLWGCLQAVLLLISHAWASLGYRRPNPIGWSRIWRIATTFLISCAVGVLFRSDTMEAAVSLYRGLIGLDGLTAIHLPLSPRDLLFLGLAAALAWFWPDTRHFFHRHWTAIDPRPGAGRRAAQETALPRWTAFALTPVWAAVMVAAAIVAVLFASRSGRFIYVQF